MINSRLYPPNFIWFILFTIAFSMGLDLAVARAQQSTATGSSQVQRPEQLAPVEIEAPRSDRRQTQAKTGTTDGGFGTGDPIPSGQPGSDYQLTPGEVVSTGGRPQNLANVPSAVSIV